jgi:hypothetical protein
MTPQELQKVLELDASRSSRKRAWENLQGAALRFKGLCCTSLSTLSIQYRKLSESKPLTLQGSDYAHAVLELNKAIDHAEGLLLQ